MGKPTVTLIGAGAMGGAMLRAWLVGGAIDMAGSVVFDPKPHETVKALCSDYGVTINPEIASVTTDVMVIAIKPQMAENILPQYASIGQHAIAVSVMAGKSVASISQLLGAAPRVIRAMPNLPASVGKGMTGLFAPNSVDDAGREMIDRLMMAIGHTVWVETEQQIDSVTAISGSGPAYYFLMTEALAQAGEALGLTSEAAAKLALATLTGAGALMDVEERSPATMREAVTSPGGTTQAALEVLDGETHALRLLIKKAALVAANRAAELTD